jgi:putative ABC transport system permease protein
VGRLLVVGRLAARDLRRRPGEAALLLLAITAATTVLTLGLALRGVIDKPYETTRKATNGPDVVAGLFPDSNEPRARVDSAHVRAITTSPGVVGHSGPYPLVPVILEANGHKLLAQTEGRDRATARVDQPKLIKGGWLHPGGVVIEAAFAQALGVSAGDRVRVRPLNVEAERAQGPVPSGPGRVLRVDGVAVTAATAPYPEPACLVNLCLGGADTGLAWLTEADALSFAPDEPIPSVVNLKLANPDAARAFAGRGSRPPSPVAPGAAQMEAWQDIRERSSNLVANERKGLMTGALLLALLAIASVAVLVGGRMADQIRRVGLLKAVGATPGLVAAVLLAEYVVVALGAAAAGIALGSLTAPWLTEASAGLLGSAGARTLTVSTVGLVAAVALGVAIAATLVPAVRAARTSTVLALADSARAPRRTPWLIRISARLPVPLLLGLRIAARRPRRLLLAIASITITVSGIVAALGSHADLNDGSNSARAERLDQVLLALVITLVALALVNAIFITWATALDARRSSALSRALGATPQQVTAGLSAAQVLPALVGALLGIPGGFVLLAAVSDSVVAPPAWQLLAVVPVTVLAIAGLTAIPARMSARRPVADILQSEMG